MSEAVRTFKPYHFAWLQAHSHRTPEWLADRLREGFDVHHLDGDHSNNDARNLVLIEHTDHMRLHGGWMLGRLMPVKSATLRKRSRKNALFGQEAYKMRQAGRPWDYITRFLRISREAAMRYARQHAERNELPWPVYPRATNENAAA